MRRLIAATLLMLGCESAPGAQILMSFDRAGGFYTAPFPSDDLLNADGSVNLAEYPNPNGVDLIDQGIGLLARDKPGFATTGGIFMQLTRPIDPASLPDVKGSLAADSPIVLLNVDPASPEMGSRSPIQIAFMADGGSFGAPNLLSILPYQGAPLRPKTRYAALVTSRVRDAKGRPLAASPSMTRIALGAQPDGVSADVSNSYRAALTFAQGLGIDARDVVGMAVFTTGAPAAQMSALRDDILTRAIPAVDSKPVRTDLFPDYCVYATTIKLPDYQEGTPPYTQKGGGWLFDSNGKPILQRANQCNLVITIPRSPMPQAGYPLVVVVQAGAGGDRALVDRGPQAMTGGPALVPGAGPALHFAHAGFAGATVDGPLEGLRNITHDNEDFLIFNIQNAEALRDNVRESALELVFFAHVMQSLQFDASDCPGADQPAAHFDSTHFGLFGHSMGAWIAPLVLANEPLYGAAILSGAGGSYVANVMYKQKPLAVKPLAEIVLDYNMDDRSLTDNDPALTMVQWAVEPSDPQVYTSRIIRDVAGTEHARHVLMEQGIVDHYILPAIANTTSLSLGLDEAGAPLDSTTPELSSQTPLNTLLQLSGRTLLSQYPVSGNLTVHGQPITAVVIQHDGDGVEDGHEVVFQTDPPKHQYRCFLQSWLAGVPKVPADDTADAPCP